MLYTYPSNRLENLVAALDTLMNAIERPPLAADVILVQHPGMQHWLSMELAKRSQNKICMNAQFPLPVRYFWDLIRLILGPEQVPDRSVYSREILVWRIYKLLAQTEVQQHPLCIEPTRYWLNQPQHLQHRRRYQLAEQQADLFEQYLMFRPQWIEDWQQNPAEHWQAYLWQLLVLEDPNHPLKLMREAAAKIEQPAQALPEHFYIFGINSLAPIWLEFLSLLGEKTTTDIHLLYLNPSAEQWDELQSEKQRLNQLIKQQKQQQLIATESAPTRAGWLDPNNEEYWQAQAGNPLLTSLGQQGQAFVRLLSDHAHQDTHLFTQAEPTSYLSHLQNDLLTAVDGRNESKTLTRDNSLLVTSAHSAFREVQGLHDWLLHQFNEDATLTPKDILVMCPNVEDYAPYIQAVFARSFSDDPESTPPLPCSIADRNLKDADPTVAAFLELLTLPDARFEVTQITSWLRVPAIADKFCLTAENIQTLSRWLARANVHWAFNADHKRQWLDVEPTNHFTWQQGLDRLLLGFAYGDEDELIDDVALLQDVEGADAILLGKLVSIIEQLQQVRSQLNKARNPEQWQSYLIEQLQIALFSTDTFFERSHQSILNAINDFTEFAQRAGMIDDLIPLSVVRHILENAFASPEQTGSQFIAGQITVCSMVPMRSIPFKVVAVLGLNDGQFPRSRPPLGFDLMAKDKPKLGDRSRRGDDRYLFLEAILSARQALYLSYQGFDIQKNEPKPASLVLEELFDYLSHAYGFDKTKDIRQLPLQPFSPKNYQGALASFDGSWLNLQLNDSEQTHALTPLNDLPKQWHLSQWVRFFSHPSQYFAQNRLGLFFQQHDRFELEDSEPFALSHLDRYQVQADFITQQLSGDKTKDVIKQQLAASAWPINALVEEQVLAWQQEASDFSEALSKLGAQNLNVQHRTFELDGLEITADLNLTSANQQLFWRFANAKGKDLISFWLHHLLANIDHPCASSALFRGPKESYLKIDCAPVTGARSEIQHLHRCLVTGHNEALFLPSDWLSDLLQDKADEKSFYKLWGDNYNARGLQHDAYIQYFWTAMPDFSATLEAMTDLYGSFIEHAEISQWQDD